MSERNTRILLDGIVESIQVIEKYTANLSLEQFINDQKKTRDAVLMQLIVIGETANRVPLNDRPILPEVESGRIIRSRHIIAHEYHGIDYEIIWKIVTVYLPALKSSIEKIDKL